MAFELLGEADCPRDGNAYSVKAFYDIDTSMQRNEYLLDNEVLFAQEYEVLEVENPETDIDIQSVINGFDIWYGVVGPDWRPTFF